MENRRPKIVVIGGGSGSSVLLKGLKAHNAEISSIVTTFDSGGSSGVLREEFGYPPLGDLRQCLLALSDESDETALLRSASEFRFSKASSLNGHSLGNLLLAALMSPDNDIEAAVARMSRMLRIKGQVIPVALKQSDLCAELEDGSVLRGESTIDLRRSNTPAIRRVFLDPPVRANPRAIAAIKQADAIVMGPGDLYTSIIPNILVTGVGEAINTTTATTVYVCNLMTKLGETGGFKASDFVSEISHYLQGHRVDWTLVNSRPVPPEVQQLYAAEQATPVEIDEERLSHYTRKHMSVFLTQPGQKVRHDPERLAEAVLSAIDIRQGLEKLPEAPQSQEISSAIAD